MAADFLQKQPARGPGRPFEMGRSGNPAGRAAAKKAVTSALAGGMITNGEAATSAAEVGDA